MINRDLLNAQKELLAHAYGQAQAYSSVILLAGYAGFFAIWSFLRQDISKAQIFISGFLIAVSLTSYIVWEVYQAYYRSRSLLGLNRAIQDPNNFENLLAEHKKAEHDRQIWFGRIWITVFGFAVITGFSAVAVMLWAFIDTLYRMYGIEFVRLLHF